LDPDAEPADPDAGSSNNGSGNGGGNGSADGGNGGGDPALATQVAVGSVSACALTGSGRVQCWGSNNRGQLGRSDVDFNEEGAPTAVPGITEATALTAFDYSTCVAGVKNGAKGVYCFGDGVGGKFGMDPAHPDYPTGLAVHKKVPLPDAISAAIIEMGSDGSRTCALTSTPEIWCWGGPDIDPEGIVGFFDAARLLASEGGICVLDVQDRVSCMGQGGFAQFEAACDNQDGPVRCQSLDNSRAISAWADFACRVDGSGQVSCAGNNTYGQVDPEAPGGDLPAVNLTALQDATDIKVGSQHACALRDNGEIWCWGRALYGATGDPNASTDALHTPRRISDIDGAEIMDLDGFYGCAKTQSGQVWCWGGNTETRAQAPTRVGLADE
jgi:alpha-tubulin suppressor-like RCC1 family protein